MQGYLYILFILIRDSDIIESFSILSYWLLVSNFSNVIVMINNILDVFLTFFLGLSHKSRHALSGVMITETDILMPFAQLEVMDYHKKKIKIELLRRT